MSTRLELARADAIGKRVSDFERALERMTTVEGDLRRLGELLEHLEARKVEHEQLAADAVRVRQAIEQWARDLDGNVTARMQDLELESVAARYEGELWAHNAQQAQTQFAQCAERADRATSLLDERLAAVIGDLQCTFDEWKDVSTRDISGRLESEVARNADWRASAEQSLGDWTTRLRDLTGAALSGLREEWAGWRKTADAAQRDARDQQQAWQEQFAQAQFSKLEDVQQAYRLVSNRQREIETVLRRELEQGSREIDGVRTQLQGWTRASESFRQSMQAELTSTRSQFEGEVRRLRAVTYISLPILLGVVSLAFWAAFAR